MTLKDSYEKVVYASKLCFAMTILHAYFSDDHESHRTRN
jgi:hypothetical protein